MPHGSLAHFKPLCWIILSPGFSYLLSTQLLSLSVWSYLRGFEPQRRRSSRLHFDREDVLSSERGRGAPGLAAPISGGIWARLDGYVRMSEVKVAGNVVTRGGPSRAIGQA